MQAVLPKWRSKVVSQDWLEQHHNLISSMLRKRGEPRWKEVMRGEMRQIDKQSVEAYQMDVMQEFLISAKWKPRNC